MSGGWRYPGGGATHDKFCDTAVGGGRGKEEEGGRAGKDDGVNWVGKHGAAVDDGSGRDAGCPVSEVALSGAGCIEEITDYSSASLARLKLLEGNSHFC